MKYKLSQICDFITEKIDVENLKNENLIVTYISTENMLPNKNGVVMPTSIPKNGKVTAYKKNDILVSNIRPYFKKIWFAEHNGGCSNDVLVFRAKDNISSGFLYYILADDSFFDYATKTAKGTKMPRGDKKAIMEYEILKTDFITQKKYATILRLLDKKIALNNKINANLEQQAQAIFKSWFVDFEPFGGVMPDDWHIGKLFEISDITMGQSPKGTSYNEKGIGMLFFQGRTDFGNRFPKIRMYTTEPKRIAEKGDILLSVRAPVGDLNIATQNCCIGRGLASIRSKFNHSSFLFYTVFNLKSQFDMFNGEGTVFGSINQKALKEMSVIIPNQKIIDEFEKIVSPIDNTIKNNFNEICYLAELRDTLLPKLMNGEIDVENVKI